MNPAYKARIERRVLRLIERHGPLGTGQLGTMTGYPFRLVKEVLGLLVAEGKLRCWEVERDYYLYG